MQEEYGTDYGRRNEGNGNKKKQGFDKWIALGLMIGVLCTGGFLGGRMYEIYRLHEVAEQVAQKCTAIMDILRSPIRIPQPGQGATPVSDAIKIITQNANPPETELMTDIKTKWIDCQSAASDEKPDPTADYAVVDIDVRLRDLNSEDFIWLDDAGVAEVGADQDVVVWVNLPDGIDKLNARFESSYPAEIKAGETGTIEVSVVCYDNHTKYVGSLTISAIDDLTLGTARRWTRNAYYDRFTVKHKYFAVVEDESRLHTHTTYSLYTSCDADTEMYDRCNGVYSVDLSLHYSIREK